MQLQSAKYDRKLIMSDIKYEYGRRQSWSPLTLIVILWDHMMVSKYTGEWHSMPYAGLHVFTWYKSKCPHHAKKLRPSRDTFGI
jgi:hypothetical protein